LGVWDTTNLKAILAAYQQTHPEITVDIRTYSQSDGMTELNLELAAGDGPDLLDLAWVNYAAYASKGILADLTESMAADGLSTADFISADLLKTGDSLYVLPTAFSVDTWKGLASVFGDAVGWTWADYQAMEDSLSAGQYMTSLTPEAFLSYNLSDLLQTCVDTDSATCDFSGLKPVLVAAKNCTFSGEFYESDFADGTVQLDGAYFSSVEEYNNLVQSGQYTLIGMPSERGGCTATFTYNSLLGINGQSGNLDGAWDLVRYAVCEYPYEDVIFFGISAYKPFVEEKIARMLDPASVYAGSEITGSEEEGYTIDGVYYEPGLVSMTPKISRAVVSDFWDFLDSVPYYYAYDSEISSIVQEEAAAYFSGDKSAEEVIAIIENRTEIYLSEQQ
jgi:hypothetical protein